jgi:predicted PurR-regulated permease PerM
MSAEPIRPRPPAEAPGATAAAGPARSGRLQAAAAARGVPLAAILVTVAVVALTYLAGKLAYRIRDVLLVLLVAGFIAVILNPLVVVLQRWRIRRRGWAVAILSVWAVLVFAGLLAAFGYPLAHGLTHFSHRLPSYVQNAEQGRGWIGHLIRHFHLQAWVTRNAPKLHSLGATLARPALTVGQGALSLLATLGTTFVLIVLFLLEGPKMRHGLLKLMRPKRAAYYTRVAGEISQSATGYALGNFLTSLIAGVVVFVTLTVLGVPFPLLWALWVALVDFLPMVGGALAGIPTVLFALSQSLTAGIVTAAAFVAYQQIENHVLNPVVMSRTVNVNPLLVLLSLLVGTSIGDWVGGFFGSFVAALLSIPVAGALQVIARELWQASAWAGPPGSEPPAGPGPRRLYLPFAIARTNDKRATPSFPAARLSGGLVGEQQFAAAQIKEAGNEDSGIQRRAARSSPGRRPPGRLRHAAGLHRLAPAAGPETVRGISPKVGAERGKRYEYERHSG